MNTADRLPRNFPNKVTKVEPLGGFRLRIQFKDGATGEHDFADMMEQPGPMLDPLRDPTVFARVHLEYGAPTWPNGYDMCPDALRMDMEDAGEL
jgi:hypothetical protein